MVQPSTPPSRSATPLPDFTHPPLVEVAFAVQYSELSDLSQAHLGRFWDLIRPDFPRVKDKPRLDPMPDPLQAKPTRRPFEIRIGRASPVHRTWFMSADDQRLVQLQPDRFAMNWRGHHDQETTYPRFDNLIQEFDELWGQFQQFCVDSELPTPEVSIIELLYVNRIQASALDDVVSSVGDISLAATEAASEVQGSLRLISPIKGDKETIGALSVAIEPVRGPDGSSQYKMDLAARIRPGSSSWDDLRANFELGRHVIVLSFDELTPEYLHKQWGRRSRQ